ncbi:MAG: ribulose-phosphate 3-epimerase [Bacteroidetes bacterium 4484_276]|nr:MAG: ribulose-phosphate 3-epimerase [Bacteroidetes bacterium 4484_276]OYT14202.1 MAG: ribulose-phosphate 3-epimerase [Bacteroidetes bacterium 4572_114]
MSLTIAPSILSANFLNLGADIQMVNKSAADWFHIDIMDGVFVPNISFGFPVLKHIQQLAEKPLDVHLMIVDPDRYLEQFKKYGAEILSVHYEACTHLHRTVSRIKELGMKAGVVLNPHTPVHFLEDIIADVDLVLLMSVNPGYGGQKFIENTYSKISTLKNLIIQKSSHALIEIDGGVTLENAPMLAEAGANVLVAGNTVFSDEDPSRIISLLKSLKFTRDVNQ